MIEEEKTPEEFSEVPPEGEFGGFGKSWDDLEAELGSEDIEGSPFETPDHSKNFWLTKIEIAELAYDASINFRSLVEMHEEAGEEIVMFPELQEAEQKEWEGIAGLALQMHGDASAENFARVVHAKTSMGLLKDGVRFDEKFITDGVPLGVQSPLVAPWECQPYQRRIPLLIFKAVCDQLYRVWDRDNELLKR